MKKGVILIILFLVLPILISVNASANVDSEIQKITYYAKEYEIGNIDYVKLLVYISEARQNLNEELGATEKQMGGVLKQEKLREILGEPNEQTKWVWDEGKESEKKMENYVPIWKKIIFDGRKIQIRLEAFPSIFSEKQFDEEADAEKTIKEGELIYRLHFGIEFKKPEEQLSIQGKINEIKSLAEIFSSESSETNAEILAKESVNAEKIFENHFRQSQGKCEDIMASIFGSENQRQTQNMIVQEISFYEGEKFEVVARLEMCDDCEWSWINLDLWVETRGPMAKVEESQERASPDEFKDKNSEYFKAEIKNLLEKYKLAVDEKNWKETNKIKQRIWAINEAWNQKSNNVWEEIDKEFQLQIDSMSQEERQKFDQNYGWIKLEQEKRKKVKELTRTNYEERKQFYLNLFSSHDKKEYSFAQIEFKKRLIELFKEKGKEICDNNQDDNQNEKVDCDDEQCGGKICGRGITTLFEGNESKETEVDFYCIAGECKAKEEITPKPTEPVCGNHICESPEAKECYSCEEEICPMIYCIPCAEDCSICPFHSAINCSGRVIFSGNDEHGCPLEPKCIEEEICNANEDCKFLCGEGECIGGACKVKELKECEETECAVGDKRVLNCQSGEEIIVEECIEGLWKKTGIACEVKETEKTCESYCISQPHIMCVGKSDISGTYPNCNCGWICEEEIAGNACITRADCGNENDVCSNGNCVSIPEIVKVEQEIFQTENFPESSPETEQTIPSSKPITAGAIFTFFRTLISGAGITGETTTGFQTEEGNPIEPSSESTTEPSPPRTECPEPGEPPKNLEKNCWYKEIYDERGCVSGYNVECGEWEEQQSDSEKDMGEDREKEDERRNQENKERCKKECARPCIDKCIREICGEEMNCNVDEESKKCESSCIADDNCIEKCMKGGDWWKEFEQDDEHKEEKGGFEAGGNCRTTQGKTEGFVWFGGWGEPFERLQPLKQKYYSGGNADWCKYELQNLVKQREEFEKGFNQEFVKWFFENYLANSAENWEQAVSGIFELYWNNVDNQREIAFRMKCLEKNNIKDVMNYNLINIKYETEYGKIEYWEEAKEVKIPEMEGSVTIISPYMKAWVFPPKSFIVYEMKKSMKEHEFPGSPEDKIERKNEEGPTAEEKEMIKQNKKFMEKIKSIAGKYDGNLDVVIQFKDLANNEVVFNLYAQVNEHDILKMQPMLPEEIPSQDVKAEIDFEKIYQLIYTQEKEMRGEMLESPPWDRKMQPMQKIKEVVNGVKMYFSMNDIMNSAKITPVEAEKDMKNLFKEFMSMMMKAEKNMPSDEDIEEMKKEGMGEGGEIWESKEEMTGEAIKVVQ